jgi:hypothetical protein
MVSKCNANAGKDLNTEKEKGPENSGMYDFYVKKGKL